MYPALAEKIGFLPGDILHPIMKFYGDFDKAVRNLPMLIDKQRGLTYHNSTVLEPAVNAVFDINPTLRKIEGNANISEAVTPDVGLADVIVEDTRLGGGWQVVCTMCGMTGPVKKTRSETEESWEYMFDCMDLGESMYLLTIKEVNKRMEK